MPSDLSENSKANYRSRRNRIQRGVETGFYTEAELPLALKTVEELNKKLGETNDTIRRPGRPRGESLRLPKGVIAKTPSEITAENRASEERLKRLQVMIDESRRALRGDGDGEEKVGGHDSEGEKS